MTKNSLDNLGHRYQVEKKVLGVDQLERLMWGAFWDLVDRDKDFRDFAMPSEIICAMAEKVHEYLPEVEDGQEVD